MDVVKVWVPLREYLSVQALYDAANALYWKISERRNSTHLAFLKHQNTKTSLCELSKNHWVIAPFYISGPIKRKLQSTVSSTRTTEEILLTMIHQNHPHT